MIGERIEDSAREEVTTLGGLIMTKLDRLPYVFEKSKVPAGGYAWSGSRVGASRSRGSFRQTTPTLPTARALRDS